MTKHLLRDLEHLKKQVLAVGSMVQGSILKATKALLERLPALAAEVLKSDDAIDRREVMVEEECLKILALHQPVAVDLRYIITVLKVNNDLERMGDLAGNIAARAEELIKCAPVRLPPEFTTMVETVQRMVADSLATLIESDVTIARRVLAADDIVDRIHRHMVLEMQALARKDPGNMEGPISVMSVSKYLERIADQCTNIAEDVIFLVEGEIVRHRRRR
ncbi:MAG TPA: phosphate signaling complex protein PhoU [Planctomycetota bacterium]|nr:phosphate signaling complex protein PhoU [Planctomycetota bacterium]